MNAQDCYIKLIGFNDEPTVVSAHRVWDKELFLESKTKYFFTHPNEDERRSVIEISHAEYLRSK